MDLKDQIKEYLQIYDVASLYVSLKPAGKNYKALCPFHSEKTPSFHVMPDRNTFACFGCNRFGDIFTLVQEMENLSFPEACRFLIDKFSLPLTLQERGGKSPQKEYQAINEIAMHYFRSMLDDSPERQPALQYLKQRGLTRPMIEHFALGFAENRWDGLYQHLLKQKVEIPKAVELGLLMQSDNRKIYDRFRGRIIFPIFSETGKILAFGGRTIVGDEAKYLNSPDSPVYRKGNHLYGFHLAKSAIREKKSLIVVEGYMDLVSLHQYGLENTVATLGTALTEKQVSLIKRFPDLVYLFFDSDKAGRAAAAKNIEKLYEQNVFPRVVDTGGAGKDPDEYVRNHGRPGVEELLEKSLEGHRFLFARAAEEFDLSVPEKKSQAVDSVMATLGRIGDSLIRSDYIERAAEFFKTPAEILQNRTHPVRESASVPVAATPLHISVAEQIFLESLLACPSLIEEVREVLPDEVLGLLPARNIIKTLFTTYKPGIVFDSRLVAGLNDAEKAAFQHLFHCKGHASEDPSALRPRIAASINNFMGKYNKRSMRDLNQQISIAERENNLTEVKRLMELKIACIQSIKKAAMEA